MRIFHVAKDGGHESTVWGFWLCEFKRLFSIVLLCFEDGSRDAYHSHAFNSVSFVLKGRLIEDHLNGPVDWHDAPKMVITRRDTFHKVISRGRTWVLSFRGPWASTWQEYLPSERRFVTLTNGRKTLPPLPLLPIHPPDPAADIGPEVVSAYMSFHPQPHRTPRP